MTGIFPDCTFRVAIQGKPKNLFMKSLILLVMHLVGIISISAQTSEGPRNPGTFAHANLIGYIQQWNNINSAALSDNNYASFGNLTGGQGSHTDYLVATNFGFDIPSGTTITGIKVEVECSDPNNMTADYSVRLVKKGVISGSNRATGTAYPTTDGYMSYGGPNDLWGNTWTYKPINDFDFGVAVSAQRNSNDNTPTAGQINSIRITVYFTYITLPVSLTSFSATKNSGTVKLTWRTNSESNMDHYEIERSSNGATFTSFASIPAQNIPVAEYQHADNHPLPGVSYYRLAMKESTGDQKYSPVVAVSFGKIITAVLYPSPWDAGQQLNVSNLKSEKLTIYFMNAGGQVLSTAVTETGLVPTETLTSRKGLVYYKIFDQSKNQVGTGTLLIQ